jgi:glycosyltransferase involved in cell wall biosynthesis
MNKPEQTISSSDISIILPAKNEAAGLPALLEKILTYHPNVELIIVDDGSTDETAAIALLKGAKVISHPYSMGNGAAIKTGARAATKDILIFMDADGQHKPQDISRMLTELNTGYDMVIGARNAKSQATFGRLAANTLYNNFARFMVNHKVDDLTSGFRAVRANKFREFLYLLPNGFSYPTTITMAFFRSGYSVKYIPIHAAERIGKSHIRPLQYGARLLLIIFKIGTLYSPLKLFVPIALFHALMGLGYYGYTFLTESRLSLATLFMLIASITIFLIGLVSEQITQLMYRDSAIHHRNYK